MFRRRGGVIDWEMIDIVLWVGLGFGFLVYVFLFLYVNVGGIFLVIGRSLFSFVSGGLRCLPTLDTLWSWIVVGLEFFEYVFELVDVFVYIATLGLFVWSRFRKME